MDNLEIIAHCGGIWASDSTELKTNSHLQHTRRAAMAAIAEGFGQEVDVMGGLMNGVSALGLTAAYPSAAQFEFSQDIMMLAELLSLRQDARADNFDPGTLFLDIKQGRERTGIATQIQEFKEDKARIFNIQSPSDWVWFNQTPGLENTGYRMYSDLDPMLSGAESVPMVQQARGIWLDQFNNLSGDDFSQFMTMASRAAAANKEVMILSGDVMSWGVDSAEHDEAKQPYRRQWAEMGHLLRDLVAEKPAAQVKILTNFPVAARDHFGPVLSA